MTNGEYIRRELINLINNADYNLLDRILGNSDEIEEINRFSRKMYKRLDEYIKGHCVDGDIEDDKLFNKLVDDWYNLPL
jgi:hypothetical protein